MTAAPAIGLSRMYEPPADVVGAAITPSRDQVVRYHRTHPGNRIDNGSSSSVSPET
jgi:hypothetical protein